MRLQTAEAFDLRLGERHATLSLCFLPTSYGGGSDSLHRGSTFLFPGFLATSIGSLERRIRPIYALIQLGIVVLRVRFIALVQEVEVGEIGKLRSRGVIRVLLVPIPGVLLVPGQGLVGRLNRLLLLALGLLLVLLVLLRLRLVLLGLGLLGACLAGLAALSFSFWIASSVFSVSALDMSSASPLATAFR